MMTISNSSYLQRHGDYNPTLKAAQTKYSSIEYYGDSFLNLSVWFQRVVFLKQLESGLLLVTGPYKLNSCPLRRIHQNFVIATSTKIDISSVKLPEIKEALFVKPKVPRSRGNTAKGGDLFEQKRAEYTPSDDRKALQSEVDKQLLGAISKSKDSEILKNYLKIPFGLNSRMFPHALKF